MSLQKLNAEFAPAPVRALLVDMDGVLFDTERRSLLSIIDIIGRQGLTITYDQLVERMGLGPKDLRRSYETLLGPAFQWQLFWDTYWAGRRAFYDEHGMPVMPGVVETLTAARKKGLACILASSSPRDQVIAHLKHAHVYDYFTDVVGGDMFEHSKPQPDIYLTAARLAKQPTAHCLVLEDAVNGVKSGRAAGAQVAMIPDIIPYSEALLPYCDYVADTMTDILPLLG